MEKIFYTKGKDCLFQEGINIGVRYKDSCNPVKLGDRCIIRSGTIIYGDVVIGNDFQTGHNVLIREYSTLGDHIVIGTNTVIEGHVSIGNFVKIESNCFIPTHVRIGSRVFIGPGVVMTNDKYPLKMRDEYTPRGPIIEDGVTLCAGVVIVPEVTIGRGSFIAAGALVTKNIPSMSLVMGNASEIKSLPEKLREKNIAKNWRRYLNEY